MRERHKGKKAVENGKKKSWKKPYTKPVLMSEEVFEKNALYTTCNPNQTPQDECPAGY